MQFGGCEIVVAILGGVVFIIPDSVIEFLVFFIGVVNNIFLLRLLGKWIEW